MKATNALVGMGVIALLAGVVSVMSLRDPVPELAAAQQPEVDPWLGVDGSVVRVLDSLGLPTHRPAEQLDGIPQEVVRTLASLDVPLVLAGDS